MGDEPIPMKPASPEQVLFAEALQRVTPEARAAYLEGACGTDTALRERVEALLRAAESAGDFLEQPPTGLAAGDASTMVVTGPSEKPGDRIGRYKLLQQIGEGGCGVVYMAEQEEPVRRRVALKVIKLGMDTKSVIARFEAERQALALMDHPNIAKVFDAGATDTGRPYFVMELVRGIKITEYCDQHNLSTAERLQLFTQVCQAIQHAHQKGIIHRDIKPSNILVTISEPGSPGCPKVIDFGIAKATTDQRLTDKTVFTAFEQFLGTPAYMSPEQAMMTSLDIDTRTDIYALGVLLYELLTGQTPFDAKELMAAGLDAMRRIIREHEPARPSTRLTQELLAADPARRERLKSRETTEAKARASPASRDRLLQIKELVNLLRGDLDWIVMKCLEKDRSRRYQTANELAMDIQRHLSNDPVLARPPSAAYRMQKAFRRNKLAFSAGLAVAAALLLTVAALAVSTFRIGHAQRKTESALGELKQTLQREEVDSYFHRITLAHRELSVDNLSGALKFLDECPKDLRGWEWNYLNRLARVGEVVLRDTNEIYSVAFRPGSQQIAAAGNDGSVKIWDVPARKVIQRLSGHTNYVFSLAFRPPDGRYLASAGADRTVRLWDLFTGREIFQRPGPAGEYNGLSCAVAFSSDGKNLLADRGDGTVTIWDADNGAEVRRLKEKHEIAATCVNCSPDGELLATGSWRGTLRIWDARTSQLLHSVLEHSHRISAISFGPGGRLLATASFDRTLKVWNPRTGKVLRSWEGHAGIIPGLAFSPDGGRLASCGAEDKTVKLWDPLADREILNLRGHSSMCHCVAFSSDGQRLASAGDDGTIRIWDATPLKPNEGLESLTCKHDSEVWSVAFSPDGRLLASGGWDNTVRLWDTHTGANTRVLRLPGSVFHVAISPDSRQLAASALTAERSSTIIAWDPLTGQELFSIREKAFPFCVIFDPTGRYVLREGTDFHVKVWDARTREDVGVLGQHGFNIWGMTFSPDGQRLATASSDRSVKVWAWKPAQLGRPREPEFAVPASVLGYGERVAFSPDGQRLVTAGKDNTVKISDARTGEELENLPGHTGEVWAVALDRQSRWLASAGQDTSIRIWDAKTFKPLRILRGHTGVIMSLAFSPDGRQLASGSRDHTVKVWDTARWGELPDL
jgi:WD40 repeat protein/serine/threonine protein kinase